MRKGESTIHYLSDPPGKILFSICFPLAIVSLVLILTTSVNNELYSRYVGDAAFSVLGYLNAVLLIFTNIMGSVWTAAWIKTAHVFGVGSKKDASAQFAQGFAALLVTAAVLVPLLLVFREPILRGMNVPEEILPEARTYYSLYLLSYLPVAFSSLFLTVVNGTCGAVRLFWVNIVHVLLALVGPVLLLPLARAGMVGFALSVGLGSALQCVFYVILFQKTGVDLKLRHLLAAIQWPVVWEILRYGLIIAAQNLLVSVGGLLLTLQTNRHLPIEYISVLQVTLPLSGVISSFASACLAFCPQNLAAEKKDRLNVFFRLVLLCSLAYGILCLGVFVLLGEWYFGRLFTDPVIVFHGAAFWRWQGISYVFMALVVPGRAYFNAIGRSKLVLLSGIGEFIACILCAFVLVPQLHELGRNLSGVVLNAMGLLFLVAGFLPQRKQITSLKLT